VVGPGNRPLVIARDGGGGGFLSAGSPFQGSRRVRAVARFQTSLVESGSAVQLVVVSVVVEERTAVLAVAVATAAAVVGGDLVVMVPVMVGAPSMRAQTRSWPPISRPAAARSRSLKSSTEFAGTPGKASCHGKSVSALAKQYGGLAAAAALWFACGCGRRIGL